MIETIDIQKFVKGEVCLQAFDAKSGELTRQVKGKNHITRRGLLEMIVPFLISSRSGTTIGQWAIKSSGIDLMTNISFNNIEDLPSDCGSVLVQARYLLLLLGDSTPIASYATTYTFTDLKYFHALTTHRNSGSDTWDPTLIKLNLSWAYGAADWSGIVNSLIIANNNSSSPVDASHRVVLATPFEKLATENAVLNWTWTINLPAV